MAIFHDILGNKVYTLKENFVDALERRQKTNDELKEKLTTDKLENFESFYDGRVWKHCSDNLNQFGAGYLWRIINFHQLEKIMDEELFKEIKKGKDSEPKMILYDPDTYEYQPFKMNYFNTWLVVRVLKEDEFVIEDEKKLQNKLETDLYIQNQLLYHPEDFESMFDGRVWLPGGVCNRKVSAGKILQIIKKNGIKVDPVLLKQIKEGDNIDGSVYVHDYESFTYESSNRDLSYEDNIRTISSLPRTRLFYNV